MLKSMNEKSPKLKEETTFNNRRNRSRKTANRHLPHHFLLFIRPRNRLFKRPQKLELKIDQFFQIQFSQTSGKAAEIPLILAKNIEIVFLRLLAKCISMNRRRQLE